MLPNTHNHAKAIVTPVACGLLISTSDDAKAAQAIHHMAKSIIIRISADEVRKLDRSMVLFHMRQWPRSMMLRKAKDTTPKAVTTAHAALHVSVCRLRSAEVKKTTKEQNHTNTTAASFCAKGDSSPEVGGADKKGARSSWCMSSGFSESEVILLLCCGGRRSCSCVDT